MPLSVPLKTSRSKGISAAQAAATLAAQSGALAASLDQKSPRSWCQSCGHNQSICACPEHLRNTGARIPPPEGPIPPVTGAVWGHGVSSSVIAARQAASYKPPGLANNTPQAVLRSFHEHEREREAKHWVSTGTQITSTRATCPVVSFHNGPSGRVLEEKSRCREIGEHPSLRNPGPEKYEIPIEPPLCVVPKGWTLEPRFKNSPFEGERKVDNPTKLIKMSTECHPLSPTYPYPEPTYKKSTHADHTLDATMMYASDGGEDVGIPSPEASLHIHVPHEAHDENDRRNAIRGIDLNAQYFKYKHKPTWGFGSSGLGFRFNPGTQFAKQPLTKPNTRLRGFRELRDTGRTPLHDEPVMEKSEKDYQIALDHALEEVAKARAAETAAATPAAPPPQPEPQPDLRKRTSATPEAAATVSTAAATGAAAAGAAAAATPPAEAARTSPVTESPAPVEA